MPIIETIFLQNLETRLNIKRFLKHLITMGKKQIIALSIVYGNIILV